MKLVYLSAPYFTDVDLSLIKNLNDKIDVFYFLDLSPYSLNSTAINIKSQYPKAGIFPSEIYPEISRYDKFINLKKTFIINRIDKTGFNLRNFILSIKVVLKLIKINPDIIHITYNLQYPEFIYYIFRKKIVLTVHDPFTHSGENVLRERIYRKVAFKLLNNFIILNRSQKQLFIEQNNLFKKNIFESRLGVYSFLNEFEMNEAVENEYILFFGRISPYKGIEYLLPAMKKVHDLFPKTKLIIAGSGNFHFEINEYINTDYIRFINRYITVNELTGLIKNSLFVICPYTDATQSGVVMSAFTFCKPVIATNVGGLSEYVENNITGLLIQPKSEMAIYESIKLLLEDKNLVNSFQANIKKKYYEEEYTWDKIADNLLSDYKCVKNNLQK